VTEARLSNVRVWFGAVVKGTRLVRTTSPFSPLASPTGLVKSRPGMVMTPELVWVSGVQSKRPVKRA
jgi:hypothetical protein